MPNFKLTIEYEGTNYHGWQKQKNKSTVQGVIEEAVKEAFKTEIHIIGQGRIDSGAHALGQVAHFKVGKEFAPLALRRALNSLLPRDIRIKNVEIVGDDFHSRYSAKLRHYRYLIYSNDGPSVWLRRFAHFYPYRVDIEKMYRATNFLIGEHDFSSFQSSGSIVRNPVREITSIEINRKKIWNSFPELIMFDIKANAFLYRMVRNIVGTLLEVGRGKITPEEIKRILELKDRKELSSPVPAYGLYLVEVEY